MSRLKKKDPRFSLLTRIDVIDYIISTLIADASMALSEHTDKNARN